MEGHAQVAEFSAVQPAAALLHRPDRLAGGGAPSLQGPRLFADFGAVSPNRSHRIDDGRNWYAYVGNDPLNWSDPTALCPVSAPPIARWRPVVACSAIGSASAAALSTIASFAAHFASGGGHAA